MIVNELIKSLSDLIKEGEITGQETVILSKDSEGNYFSPLEKVFSWTDIVYVPENTYSGELCVKQDFEEFTEGVLPEDAVSALCFWPIN